MNALPMAAAVAGAGALGALARWGTVRLVLMSGMHPTVSTLAVNLLGSFAAGFLFASLRTAHPVVCGAVFLGFLGAFTTFSTYTLETARLCLDGALLRATANLLLQNVLGLAAAFLGLVLGRLCPTA